MKMIISVMLVSLLMPLFAFAADLSKTGDSNRGGKVWIDNCGRCHNIRDARELRDDQWVTTVFHMRIRAGLTGQETRDVLAFLVATNNPGRKNIFTNGATVSAAPRTVQGKIVAGKTVNGKAVYMQTCVACHGANGKGTLPGAPNFTSSKGPLSKQDSVLIKNITQGFQSPGSPMAMPAKGGKADMTAQEIRAVLAYIRKQFGK